MTASTLAGCVLHRFVFLWLDGVVLNDSLESHGMLGANDFFGTLRSTACACRGRLPPSTKGQDRAGNIDVAFIFGDHCLGSLRSAVAFQALVGSFPKYGEPQYTPQHTMLLIMGAPRKVPLILGNPTYIYIYISLYNPFIPLYPFQRYA